jgi:hypothetical protein
MTDKTSLFRESVDPATGQSVVRVVVHSPLFGSSVVDLAKGSFETSGHPSSGPGGGPSGLSSSHPGGHATIGQNQVSVKGSGASEA